MAALQPQREERTFSWESSELPAHPEGTPSSAEEKSATQRVPVPKPEKGKEAVPFVAPPANAARDDEEVVSVPRERIDTSQRKFGC